MTIDPADLVRPDGGQPARLIHIIDKPGYDAWSSSQPERARAALVAQRYKPVGYASAILPGDGPDDWSVVTCVANVASPSSWCLAKLAETLPAGTYRLAKGEPGPAILGWMTAQYRFDRFKTDKAGEGPRVLLTPQPAAIDEAAAQARATALVRDLVNMPAAEMGPAELEHIAERLAARFSAKLIVTRGDALESGYPMIHAVGKAADRAFAPRMIELMWGREDHPRIAIIGKGVSFDSGGLDIKPPAAMRHMKKDMGGAAHALALAQLIMERGLPVRLHLLVPAAENAISGNAFRPGDVLASRKGLHVEIGNTDAEGRLLLGDALTRAGEEQPELIVDFATLTGAARVALGPDLPALFSNDDALGAQVQAGGKAADDPLWPLPLWSGYEDHLKSDIADITNSGESGFAGAISAALFLQRFVPAGAAWVHLDTFAWRPVAKPGRPKGGDALGLRAVWTTLRQRYEPGHPPTA
jgi:leucyl aminopeptidase